MSSTKSIPCGALIGFLLVDPVGIRVLAGSFDAANRPAAILAG